MRFAVHWDGELPGRGYVATRGAYTPGSPGYFNPHDGGHPPENPLVEDVRAFTDTAEITDSLTDEELEFISDRLIEAGERSMRERD